jgi:prepilin-type N-terminal cleavage/methylation domain-containing protein
MMKRTATDQKGFTLIELLVASMVFSVIFLGATTALLQIGKLYYKGVVTGRTQETTRGLTDQISQQLQFSNAQVANSSNQFTVTNGADAGPGSNKLNFMTTCVGNTRYTYRLNTQVNSGTAAGTYDATNNRLLHALWRDTYNAGIGCPAVDLSQKLPTVSGGEEVLGQNMRLANFSVTCSPGNGSNLCTVIVGVAYGDNDLLNFDAVGNPSNCKSIIGNQWCATSQFRASVLSRVGH